MRHDRANFATQVDAERLEVVSQIVERFASGVGESFEASAGNLDQVEVVGELITKPVLNFVSLVTNGPVAGIHNLVSTRQSDQASISDRCQRCRVQTDRHRSSDQIAGRRISVQSGDQINRSGGRCGVIVQCHSNQVANDADSRGSADSTQVETIELNSNIVASQSG